MLAWVDYTGPSCGASSSSRIKRARVLLTSFVQLTLSHVACKCGTISVNLKR